MNRRKYPKPFLKFYDALMGTVLAVLLAWLAFNEDFWFLQLIIGVVAFGLFALAHIGWLNFFKDLDRHLAHKYYYYSMDE